MKKRVLLATALLSILTLAGCSQGGGDCGPFLQYCEPEETTTEAQAPEEGETLGVPGVVPPGRNASDIVGDVTIVVDVIGPDNQYPGTGVSFIVEHTLVNKNDIPVVQDPYTKAWMPSPHTFVTNRTPVSYTVDILSDTESVKFTISAIVEVGGTVTCILGHGTVPIPGSARQATAITELGAGRGQATVECVYIVGT